MPPVTFGLALHPAKGSASNATRTQAIARVAMLRRFLLSPLGRIDRMALLQCVGEQIDDLLEFKPAEFVEALLS